VVRSRDVQADGPERLRGGDDARHAGRVQWQPAIAYTVVHLASDEEVFVHGTVIDVDGGHLGAAVVSNTPPLSGWCTGND
jgi:NAD(P)-dependent dehydrogenase (short-subunit alcohol dehydrogenase family)